jgi:hypothetical protein
MFLTKGVGVHRHALTAFEFAVRGADIEQQNLLDLRNRRCRFPVFLECFAAREACI